MDDMELVDAEDQLNENDHEIFDEELGSDDGHDIAQEDLDNLVQLENDLMNITPPSIVNSPPDIESLMEIIPSGQLISQSPVPEQLIDPTYMSLTAEQNIPQEISTPENQNVQPQPKPKRKRRTKLEMAAARALESSIRPN